MLKSIKLKMIGVAYMEKRYVFTQKDLKIRKYWLLFLLVSIGFIWSNFLVFIVVFSKDPSAAGFIILPMFMSLIAALLYRFAYIKSGTRLLTLILLFPVLITIQSLTKGNATLRSLLPIVDLIGVSGFGQISSILISDMIYFPLYFLSIKMVVINRNVNSIKLLNKSKPSEECVVAISTMQMAETIEDLDSTFSSAVARWPQYEPSLSYEYKTKKVDLESALLGNG